MNDNVKAWVKALRSGQYTQIRGSLHDDHGYCILGVACDVYMKATGRGSWSIYFGYYEFMRRTTRLPEAVQTWLGLKSDRGYFLDCKQSKNTLAAMNDLGASFDEIADTIESEPEGLFA